MEMIVCEKISYYPYEQTIVNTFLHLKNGGTVEFGTMSEVLLAWAKKWIAEAN